MFFIFAFNVVACSLSIIRGALRKVVVSLESCAKDTGINHWLGKRVVSQRRRFICVFFCRHEWG